MSYSDSKILTASETKKKGYVEAYITTVINKNSGGAQASYNVPNQFFERLLKENILIEFDSKNHTRNGGTNKIYSLRDDYNLVLDYSVRKYINRDVKTPRFLVTYGNGNKPQIRPTDYKKYMSANDGFDYMWFVELYNNNLEGNIMIYHLSDIDKTFTISINEDNLLNNTNKVYEENIEYVSEENTKLDKPHQRIFFGAPGTGKSYELNRQAKEYFGNNYDRVTFHPNYMYGNFVGAFKPFPKVLKNGNGEIKKDEDGNIQETITYDYIPGILMKQLIKAFINPNINYLVLIEEINRANVAAVFGDIFQLLDRKSNGESEYFIATSRELQEFLKKEFSSIPLSDEIKEKLGDNFENLYLPKNLYIWATMNSADQGVMPMDTAFRRRWEFEYLGINVAADTNKEEFEKYKFKINSTEIVLWDVFRRELNKKLSLLNIPEDKLIGPYFISKSMLEETDLDKLTDTIKNKVLMYLYEDAAKAYKSSLFAEGKYATYSSVCKYFDENALTLFKGNFDIETELINAKVSDEESIDSEE